MSKKVLLMLLLMAVFAPWAANAQKALPYSYGFENNDLDAEGWTAIQSSGSGISTSAAYAGVYGFRFNYSEQNAYLVSPVFDTSDDSPLSVSFYYKEYSSTYGDEQFYVGYTIDESVTDPSAFTYGSIITASLSWTLYENVFPAGTKRVAVKYVYNDAYYLYLDEFEFNGVNPSCPTPFALDVALTPGNGTIANLSWTENGDASSWQICLNNDEANLIDVFENPYLLTGLTAETPYTAKVRANCGTSQSAWSNTVSFTPTDAYRLTVGEGTITDRTVPMYVYYFDDYTRAQSVIPASELVAMSGGYITAITFYTTADNIPYTTVSTFDIYLAEVADATITAFVDRSAATTVFTNGTGEFVNDGSGGGLITITFETPYFYNGGNLLIGCDNNTDTGWKNIYFYGETVNGASISGYNASSTNNVSPTQRNFRPKTTFDFVPAGIDYCPRPTGLTATNVTTTSATLSWTETGEATEWDLRYKVFTGESGEVYNFDDHSFDGWTTIDADGDGYDWVLGSEIGGVYYGENVSFADGGHNGSADFVLSGSYSNYTFIPLTPDNYLVSPLMNLGGSISFWACAQDSDWAAEHFGVAVSTTGNTNAADFTTIQEWTMTAKSIGAPTMVTRSGNRDQGAWYQYTVDLSDYSGQQGYVAIRHFDCTDMFLLNVDDIAFSNTSVWTNVVGLTTTSYTLTGLAPATTYDVQVRAVCGDDNPSNWTNSCYFTTSCAPIAILPWSEDFDSYIIDNNSFFAPSNYPDDVLPTCWQFLNRSQSSSLYPQVFLSSRNVYAVSGNCLFFKSSNTTPIYAILPEFEEAVSNLKITFNYRSGGGLEDLFYVGYMTDPTDVSTFTSLYTCPISITKPQVTVYFANAPANSYMAFMYYSSQDDGGGWWGVDNIIVDVAPACVPVNTLSCSEVDALFATLNWTLFDNTQTAWDMQYATTEDFSEGVQLIENVNIHENYQLEGLSSETTYYVRVRANCGSGDVSVWSNVISFTTPVACQVPSNLAVSNISDHSAVVTWAAGSTSQSQWELQYKTADEAEWTMVQGLTETTYTFSGLVSGMSYDVKVRANCGGAYGVSDWTNSISFVANFCPLEEQCIINYSLADSYGDGWNGNAIQVVDVETNTVYTTITLATGSSGIGSIGLCPDRVYNFIWINGGWTYECSFVLSDADGNEILAGDHSDLPFNFANCNITCKRPKNLNATTIEPYSAVLTWQSGEAWDIAYKVYGGNYTVIENLENNTYTLTDLTPETTYVVKVRGNCGEEVSSWSNEYTFTTTEACVKPTNLQASVSMESVLVTWTPGSESQSEWDLQYRMAGQSEWTTVSGLTEPNYTITNLGNSTIYYVRVRGVCEVPSNWTYSISFTSEQIYVFNTYVEEDVYPMNTSIPIFGTVTSNLTSAPVANMEVEIGITVMGWRRTLTAVTDGNGQFAANFEPLPLESGYYTVNSGTVGSNSNEVHDSFDIMGMNVMEYTLDEELNIVNTQWLLCNVIQYIPKTGHILIRNNNSFALTNVQISVISAPEGASFTFTPTSVAGLTEGYIEYTALGTILTPGYTYQEVRLRATCDQGAEAIFTMWFYCEEARGILNASPTAINTTMTRGSSKTIDVTLSNNGHAASGEINISLPNEEWMSVVGETTLPSIEVGETATFTLRLSPDNTVPLAQFSGNIVVSCNHGESVTIPYSILAVSEENGTLVVDVTDEFTTNTNDGNGPHVEGAEVTLKGYYSQEIVAHGFTAADGTFTVEDLVEGYYNLSVQAGAHSRYDGTIYVEAGVTNLQNVFLQYQCVSYSWHVEPTEITDEYTIVLNMEFEVEVPVPVITIQAPGCVTVEGDSYTFNYVITNHGLIDAYNLALYVPDNEYYLFTPLYDFIDTIHGHSSVEIPCVVTLKTGVNDPGGEWGQSRVQYSYLSGDDMVYNQSMNYTRLGCSSTYIVGEVLPPLIGGGGSGGGAPVMPGVGPVDPGNGGYTTPWIDNQLPTVDVRVGVQFTQRLTMTREAFIGTFAVHNGHGTNAVNGIGLDFIIKNEQGVDCTDLFQIAVQSLDGVTSIDGNGTLAAGADGTVQILFIPTKEAAPIEPVLYSFGGTFTFVDPWDYETRVMNLYPTELEVHPSPDLYIDYFVQEDVYGDNPITLDSIEPIIPAELAVRIWNKGAGTAKNVILESAEPVIMSNQQGLLIEFGLYGAYIDGVGVQPGLNRIEFGDIESGETKVGEWLFTSSLLAHLVSYDAHVIHNNSYGNPNLSLVSHVGIHRLTRAIHTINTRVDAINDFLVDDIPDENNYPDSIFFSNGGRTSVGVVEGISFDKFVTPHDTIVTLTVNPSRIGWNYGETEDPGKNRYELVSCTRNNDGENIPLSNVWQESIILHETGDSLYANKLRIVDTVSVVQTVTYTLVFAGNPSDPYIFFGDEDEYWSNVANWEGFVKPLSQNDNVIIDGECLLDEDATVKNVLIVEDKRLTIPDGRILTVSNNLENAIASGLVIEEGGQLLHSNAGTQAVFEKGITPYTPGTKDGWHLVAHPMASNVAITSVEDMMVNEYDLYYYDEPTVYWINQEDASNNFTELENGKGYLYGNNEEVLLKFAGELQNGSAMVEIPLSYTAGPRLAGFNLVGNPYAHNITTYTSVNVVDGCFVMNDPKDDLVVSEINSDNPLKPGEGFFVKATDENASITFNPQRIDLMNPKGAIRVELTENGKLVDRLIVKTDEGQPLEKFSLNEQRTKLFAEGDSQELAIVPCRSNEQPVSFKASKNGQYTVAVNTDGMEFDYLHLVDNLTGKDVDLLVDPSYTFDARTSDYASRFLLRFIMREGNASETENFVFFFNDKLVIANEGRATLQVVDLLGRILESEQINGSCEKQLHTAPGVYMFRLINGDNVKVQKVVVER